MILHKTIRAIYDLRTEELSLNLIDSIKIQIMCKHFDLSTVTTALRYSEGDKIKSQSVNQ